MMRSPHEQFFSAVPVRGDTSNVPPDAYYDGSDPFFYGKPRLSPLEINEMIARKRFMEGQGRAEDQQNLRALQTIGQQLDLRAATNPYSPGPTHGRIAQGAFSTQTHPFSTEPEQPVQADRSVGGPNPEEAGILQVLMQMFGG